MRRSEPRHEHIFFRFFRRQTHLRQCETAPSQADAPLAQFMAVEDDASLVQRVREVVASNRRKAQEPRKAAA